MMLDHDRCYRAVQSRDPRFDGRFFTAVTSTGIYCRPVCPARTPASKNVVFFPCAAAAEKAGFRPCKRCRPESAPGLPPWLGTSATVTRALRLIEQGVLDEASVDDLADRLGVTARHLRRLFLVHLGATPVALAQNRRIFFARNLLEQTDLPMLQVAEASGFSSLRRFNHCLLKAFGEAPSRLRRRRRKTMAPTGPGLRLRLPYREPFDWQALLRFFAPRAIPGVEWVGQGNYRRSTGDGQEMGWIQVDDRPPHLELRVHGIGPKRIFGLVEQTRRLFDLACDPRPIWRVFKGDPLLGPRLAKRPGLRLPGAWTPFELAARAVVGQQISVKGAATLLGRLALRLGTRLEQMDVQGLTHLFPGPEQVVQADLRSMGLTHKRAEALRGLALGMLDGRIVLDGSRPLDELVHELIGLPGIGPWTAQVIALRLGEPDAFPAGDLGLRKSVASGEQPETRARLEHLAEPWRPWRAYAAALLWSQASERNGG